MGLLRRLTSQCLFTTDLRKLVKPATRLSHQQWLGSTHYSDSRLASSTIAPPASLGVEFKPSIACFVYIIFCRQPTIPAAPLIHYVLLEIFLFVTTCSKINVRFNNTCSRQTAIMLPAEPIACTTFWSFARLHFLALFLRRLPSFC